MMFCFWNCAETVRDTLISEPYYTPGRGQYYGLGNGYDGYGYPVYNYPGPLRADTQAPKCLPYH